MSLKDPGELFLNTTFLQEKNTGKLVFQDCSNCTTSFFASYTLFQFMSARLIKWMHLLTIFLAV